MCSFVADTDAHQLIFAHAHHVLPDRLIPCEPHHLPVASTRKGSIQKFFSNFPWIVPKIEFFVKRPKNQIQGRTISKNCCHSTCYFFPMFFNMLFFFQHAVFLIQHAVFFLHDFQHARFCRSIFQHTIWLIEHAFFSCSNFNMLYSSPPFFNMPFQHARFCWTIFQHAISFIEHAFGSCSNFNMLYSSPPIFNMSFQHARICWTFFQHAVSFIEHAIVFCRNCNVGMVQPACGRSVNNLRGQVSGMKRPSLLNGGIMRLQCWCLWMQGGFMAAWQRTSVPVV